MRRWAGWTLLLMLASMPAAHACTPIMSVGFAGVFAGWAVWLALALAFHYRHPSVDFDLTPWCWLPFCFVPFSVPLFALMLFPFALMVFAFPMHLAVEFFSAWSRRKVEPLAASRMGLYGLPLVVTIAVGAWAKWALYGPLGGLRVMLWNYGQSPEVGFLVLAVAVGAAVLVRKVLQPPRDLTV